MHKRFYHSHTRQFAAAASATLTAFAHDPALRDAAAAMAPRAALALPIPTPGPEPAVGGVQDIGDFVNGTLTKASHPYFYGLAGVNQGANYLFANVLVASFFGLLLFTFALRWWSRVMKHVRHLLTMGREVDQRYWMMNHDHHWPRIKKHLIYAPLGRLRHNREFQLGSWGMGTLPTRYHTVLLGLYIASNIAYCLVLDYSQDSFAILAELRGRTGVMAALNVIPTVLFALRNQPFIPILGVSYDTFNLLHRWCARAVIIEGTVHTLCWAANAIATGGQEQVRLSLSTSVSYKWGMVSTAAFGAIFVLAAGPIRHKFYETFLNFHRILVLMSLVGLYVHLDAANLPMKPYVQLVFAFWGAEYAWRWYRIIYHNLSRQKGLTKVKIEALPSDACRVTFELSRPWRYFPGCHVHMYVPTMALWSSHPFSIAWAENKSRGEPPKEVEMEVKHTGIPQFDAQVAMQNLANQGRPVRPPFQSKESGVSGLSASPGSIATVTEVTHRPEQPNITLSRDASVTHLSLICRARTGLTRKMFEKASKAPGQVFTTWGAIEGPYGGHESLSSYGTVVLFAGGVGITHQVGYIKHLILQYQAGTSSTRKILLVWSVPNTEALEWVRVWMDQILRMEGRRDILRIELFVTKPRARNEVVSNTGSVQMHPGRCNPKTILEREMAERIGAMGVTVCGPGAFSDTVRAAVRQYVDVGYVDFVEEAFTY